MADQTNNKGFSLPPPSQSAPAQSSISKSDSTSQIILPSISTNALDGPEPRDYVIAGTILGVFLIAFFFARSGYANYLVGKKVSPNSANAAGWWLFIFLTGLATAGVMAILSPVKFLTPLFMAPLGLISFAALILVFLTGRQK